MDLHPYLFCLSFYLLYFFLPPFKDNGLLFWVPDVLCWHSEVVLWNLLNVQIFFFWWICGGESGIPILFLHHLRTAPRKLTFSSHVAGHCWVFQICWHIECSTLTASSFRIWKSSTGISSPPLALFIAMLPKAHLTSHSSMSGSRWVITPSWLSGSWRSFLYSCSVYSCHLFLISSASVRYHFYPLLGPSLGP